MQTVDEKPETIHLCVVREELPQPQILPIILSVLAFSVLVAVCTLFPYQQPVMRKTLRVPAVLLPLKTFTAEAAIIPTGVKTYPAMTAHGILTVTNGSVISQTIPQGFNIGGETTDEPVFVPAGSANGYGVASVTAHALSSGTSGNIPAYAINQVVGSSVYIRNLSAFSGGRNAYSVKFITLKDRLTSLLKARQLLTQKSRGLHYPCKEVVLSGLNQHVVWVCQFFTYKIPTFMSVTQIRIIGKVLLLDVWFVVRPTRIWVK